MPGDLPVRVVRVRPDRSIEVLGECHDFEPAKQPGDTIAVKREPERLLDAEGRTLPYCIVNAAAPRIRFRVLGLWREGGEEAVVEAEADGPHPSFLPGWRPTPA